MDMFRYSPSCQVSSMSDYQIRSGYLACTECAHGAARLASCAVRRQWCFHTVVSQTAQGSRLSNEVQLRRSQLCYRGH